MSLRLCVCVLSPVSPSGGYGRLCRVVNITACLRNKGLSVMLTELYSALGAYYAYRRGPITSNSVAARDTI